MSASQRILCMRCVAVTLTMLIAFLVALMALDPTGALFAAPVASALAFLAWDRGLKHWLRARKFAGVMPGRVYRSGQLSPLHVRCVLRRCRIATVIDLTGSDAGDPFQSAEARAITELGIRGLRFPMDGDGTGELEAVAAAVTALHRSMVRGEPVLVHCAAGVQRTGHVLSAWLLLVVGAAPDAVHEYMARFGWDPERSRAWPEQLNRRMPALAQLLRERGVISAVPGSLPWLPVAPAAEPSPWWMHRRQVLRAGLAGPC